MATLTKPSKLITAMRVQYIHTSTTSGKDWTLYPDPVLRVLQSDSVSYPDTGTDATPMMKYLKFEPRFLPAMRQVGNPRVQVYGIPGLGAHVCHGLLPPSANPTRLVQSLANATET